MKRHNTRTMPLASDDQTQFAQIPPLDVLGMLRVVWHSKWVIGASATLAITCGTFYAFQMSGPKFAATVTLQVDARQAHLGDVSDQWQTPSTDLSSLNTEVTILTSDSILLRVILQLNLMEDPEFNRYLAPISPFAVNSIRGQIRQFLSGTKDLPPDTAAITQKTVQNLRGRLSVQRPRDTYLFQITAHSNDPDKAAEIANSAASAYLAAQIESQEAAADAAIGWLAKRVATLRAQLERQEVAVTTLIATVQVQEETALDMLSTVVLAVDEERAAAAATLAIYDGASANTAREAAAIAQMRAQIAEIDARRARLLGQLEAQSTGIVALQQMQREADSTRVLYQSFLTRLQETQVQRGLAYPDSRLVAPAAAGRYVGPQKTLLVTAAGLLGGLLGLALVAARHITRLGVFHPQELHQKSGKPVFATLSDTGKRFGRISIPDQSTTFAMHKIQAGLMRTTGHAIPQIIMVTSSTGGEEHDTLAIALAKAIGTDGRSTLLINADPESACSKQVFAPMRSIPSARAKGAMTSPELSFDVLREENLESVFAAGFRAQIDMLKGAYDCIVILAPPVLTGAETQLLARYADGVIYAVRWARTPISAVLYGLDLLEQSGDAPIGLILTQAHTRKMRRFAAIAGASVVGLEMA